MQDPEHRTCLFHNICIVNGSLAFFQRPTKVPIPEDYTPVGFENGNIFHTGHLRGFTVQVKTIFGPMSSINSPFTISPNLTFLGVLLLLFSSKVCHYYYSDYFF